MTKHLVAAAAAVALCFVAGADQAEARGFHIQAGGVQVVVGNPHGYGYGRHVVGYGGYGHRGYGHVQRSYYGGGYGGWHGHGHGHSRWHDTSHYDYHGPSLVPHGNHYDYVPGHYHFHREGHWDHH